MTLLHPFFLQSDAEATGTPNVGNAISWHSLPLFMVSVDTEPEPEIVGNAVSWLKLPFFTVSVSETE